MKITRLLDTELFSPVPIITQLYNYYFVFWVILLLYLLLLLNQAWVALFGLATNLNKDNNLKRGYASTRVHYNSLLVSIE